MLISRENKIQCPKNDFCVQLSSGKMKRCYETQGRAKSIESLEPRGAYLKSRCRLVSVLTVAAELLIPKLCGSIPVPTTTVGTQRVADDPTTVFNNKISKKFKKKNKSFEILLKSFFLTRHGTTVSISAI